MNSRLKILSACKVGEPINAASTCTLSVSDQNHTAAAIDSRKSGNR